MRQVNIESELCEARLVTALEMYAAMSQQSLNADALRLLDRLATDAKSAGVTRKTATLIAAVEEAMRSSSAMAPTWLLIRGDDQASRVLLAGLVLYKVSR